MALMATFPQRTTTEPILDLSRVRINFSVKNFSVKIVIKIYFVLVSPERPL